MSRNLTDGFGHYYRAGPERIEAAFRTGLIVLDTNVLLHLLRYSPSARDELVGVIEAIAYRCFVPHQIALEYNRSRVSVVVGRQKELTGAADEIDSIRSASTELVKRLRKRRMLPLAEVQHLEESVAKFMGALDAASAEAAEQYDLDPTGLVGRLDPWTMRLTKALEGRVGDRPDDEVLSEDEKESSRRRRERLAPGFKDDAGGDYLWWAEVMRYPELKGRPLVIVSDDTGKDDWLFKEHGITVGPQSVLIDDAIGAGATDLALLPTSELLRLAETIGVSQVSESTIVESEQAQTPRRVDWTLVGYVELINMLERDSFVMRAKVVRAAARNGGSLSRHEVYRIAGISEEERSLRQFATPVQRLSGYLLETGAVPNGVGDPLRADYDGPGKAIGYSVPAEFIEFETVVSEAEEIIVRESATDWSTRDQVQAQMRSAIRRRVHMYGPPEAVSRVVEILISRAEALLTEEA